MRFYRYIILFLLFYIVIQFVYVLFFRVPLISDSASYVGFARSAIEEGTYYPNPSSLKQKWLVAPVYINYIEGLLRLRNDVAIIHFFNIALNMLQLSLVFIIVRKMYDHRTAFVAIIIYAAYLNNLGLVMMNLTEFMFGIFVLLSLYLFISTSSIWFGVLCGISTGLAIGVRPTGYALIIAFIMIYIIDLFRERPFHIKMTGIIAGLVFYIIVMGSLTNANIGYFKFTSTTGPDNLIMSATPGAKGVYNDSFFSNDSIYNTIKTFPERNDYVMGKAKRYIFSHPVEWLSLIPRKIYSTYIFDGWTIEYLLSSNYWNLNTYIKGDHQVRSAFKQKNFIFKTGFWVLNIWQQLVYGFIMILFSYQIVKLIIEKKNKGTELVLNLFIFIGVGLSILGSVGNARYKYNFLIVGIILVSPVAVTVWDYVKGIVQTWLDRSKTGT